MKKYCGLQKYSSENFWLVFSQFAANLDSFSYKICPNVWVVHRKFDTGAAKTLRRAADCPGSFVFGSFKAVFLNRREASRYRDLETISPGLRTLKKVKVFQKMYKNCLFLNGKTWKKSVTGTIDHKTNVFRGKRLQKILYRNLNQKRLRAPVLKHIKNLIICKTFNV